MPYLPKRSRPLSWLVAGLAVLLSSGSPLAQDASAPEADPGTATATVRVSLKEAPRGGQVRVLLFDSSVTFGRFSDPARVTIFPPDGRRSFEVTGVEPGTYAVVLHHDLNTNNEFDKNFIGIPTEPIAISRGYRPKGPPVWARASFPLTAGEEAVLDLELFSVLGKLGLLGFGVGVVARSSPYVGSDSGVFQPIPAITYNGERLQWFGPSLRFGLVGRDRLRLAATASYRLGPYDEEDSPILTGMGDRGDTLMAGLAVIGELPQGVNMALGYEHDVLNQFGGGTARLVAARGWQWGITRFSPNIGVNWNSAAVSNFDYGVPANQAIPGRPAYEVGSALSLDVGVGTFIEITRNWRIVGDIAVEFLPSSVTNSPIVGSERVLKGFLTLTYTL